MTWEKLKEKAKEMGYIIDEHMITIFHDDMFFRFSKMGTIFVEYAGDSEHHGLILTRNRTPKQMLQIMEAME